MAARAVTATVNCSPGVRLLELMSARNVNPDWASTVATAVGVDVGVAGVDDAVAGGASVCLANGGWVVEESTLLATVRVTSPAPKPLSAKAVSSSATSSA